MCYWGVHTSSFTQKIITFKEVKLECYWHHRALDPSSFIANLWEPPKKIVIYNLWEKKIKPLVRNRAGLSCNVFINAHWSWLPADMVKRSILYRGLYMSSLDPAEQNSVHSSRIVYHIIYTRCFSLIWGRSLDITFSWHQLVALWFTICCLCHRTSEQQGLCALIVHSCSVCPYYVMQCNK